MYPNYQPPTPQRANNREKTLFAFTLVILVIFAAYRLIDRYMEMREIQESAKMLNTGIQAIKQITYGPDAVQTTPQAPVDVKATIPDTSPVVTPQPTVSSLDDYMLGIQPSWNHFVSQYKVLWVQTEQCVNNPQYFSNPNLATIVLSMNNVLINMDSDLATIYQSQPVPRELNYMPQQMQKLRQQVSQLRFSIDCYLRRDFVRQPHHFQSMTQYFETLDYSIDATAEYLNASSRTFTFHSHSQRNGLLGGSPGMWPGATGSR